jgi:hypothetical protein
MRVFLCLLAASLAAFAQKHTSENPRGQSPPPDESQSWTRGRLGTQQPLPGKFQDLTGILLDASCDDRSALNLTRPPEQPEIAPPPNPSASKRGAVPPPEVAAHLNPDVPARQPDPACGVTAATRGFALLTREGRLLNLDEGGNTLALQALYATPAGRAMLNGAGGALKPQSTVRGRLWGDRLIVDKIVKL